MCGFFFFSPWGLGLFPRFFLVELEFAPGLHSRFCCGPWIACCTVTQPGPLGHQDALGLTPPLPEHVSAAVVRRGGEERVIHQLRSS